MEEIIIEKKRNKRRGFKFRFIEMDIDLKSCSPYCPYGIKICGKLPYPCPIDDECSLTFRYFCSLLEEIGYSKHTLIPSKSRKILWKIN